MKVNRLVTSSIFTLGFIIILNSCSKNSNDAVLVSKASNSYDLIQSRIFDKTCATSGCHASEKDGSFKQHGLVLTASVAYDNLFDKDPANANALADKYKRIKPFFSLESLLFHKLNWNSVAHHSGKSYGNPMPLGGTALSVGQIEFVRRWIEAGAPRTGSVADTVLLNDKTASYIENFIGLEAPKPTDGLQIVLNKFDVAPSFERELFRRQAVGNTQDLYVNRVQIKMRQGSHHFILYSYRDQKAAYMPPYDQLRDIRNPDGSNNLLTLLSMSNHVFWAGAASPNHDYTLPAGAALLLPAGYSFDLNSHYVNKTSSVMQGEVYANLYTIPKSQVQNIVYALDLGNTNLDLPAGKETTVSKTFTFAKKTNILMLTSHNHKLGTKFVIKITGGARDGEVVYENTDWEHPLMKNFDKPLVLVKGEGLTSVITYNNTTTRNVKFGLTSEDEMGIIFGYFYEN